MLRINVVGYIKSYMYIHMCLCIPYGTLSDKVAVLFRLETPLKIECMHALSPLRFILRQRHSDGISSLFSVFPPTVFRISVPRRECIKTNRTY